MLQDLGQVKTPFAVLPVSFAGAVDFAINI
jgi:hypothetical protein